MRWLPGASVHFVRCDESRDSVVTLVTLSVTRVCLSVTVVTSHITQDADSGKFR